MSKETGISQSTLSDWKNGKITPKSGYNEEDCRLLRVSVDYLMTGTEREETVNTTSMKKPQKWRKNFLKTEDLRVLI